jgi:hypothetical protein
VITGTSTRIGEACALHLDKLGFQVFGRDNDENLNNRHQVFIRSSNKRLYFIPNFYRSGSDEGFLRIYRFQPIMMGMGRRIWEFLVPQRGLEFGQS